MKAAYDLSVGPVFPAMSPIYCAQPSWVLSVYRVELCQNLFASNLNSVEHVMFPTLPIRMLSGHIAAIFQLICNIYAFSTALVISHPSFLTCKKDLSWVHALTSNVLWVLTFTRGVDRWNITCMQFLMLLWVKCSVCPYVYITSPLSWFPQISI